MQVKIFRDLDIEKLEKEINEFIDNDYISVKDIKVTTDVVYNRFDHLTKINMSTTVVIMYEINDYGYYEQQFSDSRKKHAIL